MKRTRSQTVALVTFRYNHRVSPEPKVHHDESALRPSRSTKKEMPSHHRMDDGPRGEYLWTHLRKECPVPAAVKSV